MKLKLYIDFDGVILNTIDISYKMLEEEKIDPKNLEAITNFYINLDWKQLLEKSEPINHSIECLKKLMESDKFDISILTHVTSKNEINEKKAYMKKKIPDLNVIFVDKKKQKCDVVECKNAILVDDYMGNLELWEKKGGIPIKFSTTGKKYSCIAINSLDTLFDLYNQIQNQIQVKKLEINKKYKK